MQVTVTFKHMESTEPLKDYASDKSARLAKYLASPIEVHWFLSVEKIRHIAEATVAANGVRIKAKEESSDMYAAIDTAMDKLEKQVRKHKEKIKDHHKTETAPTATIEEIEAVSDTGGSSRVVETSNYFVKPMSVEEARLQMDIAEDDFLVFTNSNSNDVNVLYRRDDGNYGLIEANS